MDDRARPLDSFAQRCGKTGPRHAGFGGEEIVKDFLYMIKEKPELSSKNLKDDEKTKLMCLSGVKQYPMRVKCATLSWHTLTSAIDNSKKEVNTEKLD